LKNVYKKKILKIIQSNVLKNAKFQKQFRERFQKSYGFENYTEKKNHKIGHSTRLTASRGKTAESRYLIFETDLLKLYWTIGPEILPFASLNKCYQSIVMPLFTDQARDQT